MPCTLLTPLVLILCIAGPLRAHAASDFALRVVFFTPSDVEPPEGAKKRMLEIIHYTEDFYNEGMKHWGYTPASPLRVPRDKNGDPEILFIKGKSTKASGKPGLSASGIEKSYTRSTDAFTITK